MDRVLPLRLGVQLAHRARGGLGRIGRADRRAKGRYGLVLFQDHRHARTAGHEVDELAKKRALLVHFVKSTGLGRGQVHDARGLHLKALLLKQRDDIACIAGAEGVGLDDRKSATASHGPSRSEW